MLVFCILNLILRSNTNMIKDREIKEARSVMIGRDNLMWIIQLDFQQILNYFYYFFLFFFIINIVIRRCTKTKEIKLYIVIITVYT